MVVTMIDPTGRHDGVHLGVDDERGDADRPIELREAVAAVEVGGAPTTVPPVAEGAEAEDNEARKSS